MLIRYMHNTPEINIDTPETQLSLYFVKLKLSYSVA
jgi:hypothetical protein